MTNTEHVDVDKELFWDTFSKEIGRIAAAVQKWPNWKREGWAILDLKPKGHPATSSTMTETT